MHLQCAHPQPSDTNQQVSGKLINHVTAAVAFLRLFPGSGGSCYGSDVNPA